MCGSDGTSLIPDENTVREDGAKGIYAPMNDIKRQPKKTESLDEIFKRQGEVEDKADAGDHQNGCKHASKYQCESCTAPQLD